MKFSINISETAHEHRTATAEKKSIAGQRKKYGWRAIKQQYNAENL